MSGVNGDKSRFNRDRKQNIERRQKNRILLKNLESKAKLPPAGSKPKEKIA
jgi:hypothetical protein